MGAERPRYNDELEARRMFGNQLRSLREDHGKSQAQWAADIGVDPSVLSRIETADQERIPPRSALIGWAKKWELTPEEGIWLLVSGYYLPELPIEFCGRVDLAVVVGAMSEMIGVRKGRNFLELIKGMSKKPNF